MIYHEKKEQSQKYKEEYLNGIENIIKERQKRAEGLRAEYTKDIFKNQGKYRNDFKEMLGWPLVNHERAALPDAKIEKLSDEDGYTIFRVTLEILKGLKMTGLFFKMNGEEKKPLVIVQHGGGGTPEKITGFYDDTSNYNNILHRVITKNVHAFAPQLLLWYDDYGAQFDRKAIDARLKRVGSSVTALEVFGITRIIDYFEAQSYVSNFGMVGLSYGGFYTLFTAAVDIRIKSSISCSYFNKRDAIPWSDWTWLKSAEKFDDAEIACMVYPRKICLEIGNMDEAFDYKGGVESFEKIKKMSKKYGMGWIELIVFDGVHEFCRDDRPIEKMITELKGK